MHVRLKFALLGAVLAGVTALAQAPATNTAAPPNVAGTAGGPVPTRNQSFIYGQVVDGNSAPIPNARVQLRNLETTQIEQVSRANYLGEFGFVVQPEIPYVVELADQAGRIIAVGDVITAHAGDVAAATMVALPRSPTLAGVFRDTAMSVMSAATATGFTAVQATVAPFVSPER